MREEANGKRWLFVSAYGLPSFLLLLQFSPYPAPVLLSLSLSLSLFSLVSR